MHPRLNRGRFPRVKKKVATDSPPIESGYKRKKLKATDSQITITKKPQIHTPVSLLFSLCSMRLALFSLRSALCSLRSAFRLPSPVSRLPSPFSRLPPIESGPFSGQIPVSFLRILICIAPLTGFSASRIR